MPTYEEFINWDDEEMQAISEKCQALNPRHFDLVISEGDQKKSES